MIGAILAGSGVAAGAFGAHALKEILDAPMLQVFETATRYVMYHAFGLCIVSLAIDRYPEQGLEKSGWFLSPACFFFRQSLCGVSCRHQMDGGCDAGRWASLHDRLAALRLGSLAG